MPDNNFLIERRQKDYYLVDNMDGSTAFNATIVSVKHDDNALYFDFVVGDDAIKSYGTVYNQELWQGDIVEILLTTGDISRYLEIEVNPHGIQYAVIITNKDLQGDIDILPIPEPPFVSKVISDNSGWKCSIIINKDQLKQLGWQENNSFLNIHRQDYRQDGELKLYSLSPTKCASFHIPKAFKKLKIKD